MNGFHSTAGWLLVSLVAYGLIVASWRISAFTRIASEPKALEPTNPAGVYLVPLLAIIATAMLTKIFYSGFDLLYPLRVLAAAGALYFYRRELAAIGWSASLWSVAVGPLVFAVWLIFAPPNDASVNAVFAAGISGLSAGARAIWFFFRIVGAIVTVPIAEELAFRGYLMRKLIADDFESARLGQFTWVSFLVSSALFGVLHGQWLAGTFAGMVFAAAVYRRAFLQTRWWPTPLPTLCSRSTCSQATIGRCGPDAPDLSLGVMRAPMGILRRRARNARMSTVQDALSE